MRGDPSGAASKGITIARVRALTGDTPIQPGPPSCNDQAMLSLLVKVAANAVALWVATVIVPKVSVQGGTKQEQVIALLVVGAALALVNAFVKPVIKALTGCFYLLTLGLMALIVNAAMLRLAGWLAGKFGAHFSSGPFLWSTVLAALVVALVSMIVSRLLGEDSKRAPRRS
jgi:putative membrane protein